MLVKDARHHVPTWSASWLQVLVACLYGHAIGCSHRVRTVLHQDEFEETDCGSYY
jgi:hypothetical protein